jgi:ABC-type dipeptide/oligopeptide/nickel transport system ATPase component
LSKKITVDVRGEILELKNTINTMVDQLNSFGSEVTRVAREVADRVLVMADGQIIEDAKPDALFNKPKDPRTKALIDRYRTGNG